MKLTPVLLVFFCFSQKAMSQNTLVDKIIAKVDKYIILKSEVEFGYQQLLNSGASPDNTKKCDVLERLVMNKMLLAKAAIDSIEVESSIVDGELNRRMKYFITQAGGEAKLKAHLGKSANELKVELRDQVKEQLTLQRAQLDITERITVTPTEVKAFFERSKDSIPLLPSEVEVAQVVLYPKINKEVKNNTKKKLFAIRERIIRGEKFEKLAKEYSEDLASRVQGGLLGWSNRGELVPEYEATALNLAINEISDPVETEYGIHIIQLLDRRGNKFKSRHILLRLRSDDLDIANTAYTLDSLRSLILLDSLSFENVARAYSEDNLTKGNGGFFRDPNTSSSLIPTDILDPDVFFIVDTMQVGRISAPLEFRAEDGRKALRMVYYKSFQEAHLPSLKIDFQKIARFALERKKNVAIFGVIREMADKLYISIDPEYKQCTISQKIRSYKPE